MTTSARQLSLFRGKRQRGERPPLAKERETHISVADALRVGCTPGWEWNHFPSGEERPTKINPKTGKKWSPAGELLKRMGHKPGWSDFILISPQGLHCWLELKRGSAPLSEEQEAFRDAMLKRGVPWAVARSFNEAIAQLTAWGALRLSVSA